VHPHFQLVVSTVPSNYAEEIEGALEKYYKNNGTSYWEDLVSIEKENEERYIDSTGSVEWLTTFSPRGAFEVLGICPSGEFSQFSDEIIRDLSEGMSKVLSYYGSEGFSSFNLSINIGRLRDSKDWSRVFVRLVIRQNFSKEYRAGEHFFQHLLETEVILVPPEVLAKELREYFQK
jgi:galactose-1-phosphate uridylyltransferase